MLMMTNFHIESNELYFQVRNKACGACKIVSEVSLTSLLDAEQTFLKLLKPDLM